MLIEKFDNGAAVSFKLCGVFNEKAQAFFDKVIHRELDKDPQKIVLDFSKVTGISSAMWHRITSLADTCREHCAVVEYRIPEPHGRYPLAA